MKNLEVRISALVASNGPIKARQIARILKDEFGVHVDRSTVNSHLYALEREKKAKKSALSQWTSTTKGRSAVQATVNAPALTFTAEQQAAIDLAPDGNLLVRGQAGSGKTTVLAARAGHIRSSLSKGDVLFLTYNGALCESVARSFESSKLDEGLTVRTFHQWCRDTGDALGAGVSTWVDAKERSRILKDIIDDLGTTTSHRLLSLESQPQRLEWWSTEIAWMLGQYFERLEDYKLVERAGRGTDTRVTREDRELVWGVYEAYAECLEERDSEDYDNPAGPILRALDRSGATGLPDDLRFDHVMIDEVQDFDRSWLLAAAMIPRTSLSMAGDLAQRIYRRSFTWRSVGIELQGGRSRRLGGSHRTTRQIMRVASQLLTTDEISLDPDYVAPATPKRSGPLVQMVRGESPRDAYDRGYDFVADRFGRLRKKTVAVAFPFARQTYAAVKSLEERGCKAAALRGAKLGNHASGIAATTFHQLKGLEFDHVVIMGLHDGQYPGRLLDGVDDEDRAEVESLARRVLYVAMTRARESVTLVGSRPLCRFFEGVEDRDLEFL